MQIKDMTVHVKEDNLSYRRDIDGLRAVAVLSVVAYHAFPQWVRGGFVGVDIFFIISGYLISRILLTDLEGGALRLGRFYQRRIRRILPALTLVLGACLCFGGISLLSDEYRFVGKHVAGGAAFAANFVLKSEVGYFDPMAELKPLLHLWSLGIEEQFYIIWPVVLLICHRKKIDIFATISILISVSLILCVWGRADHQADRFFSPHTRMWELMLGSMLAFLALAQEGATVAQVRRRGFFSALQAFLCRPRSARMNGWLSLLGAGLLLLSITALTREIVYPGFWALLPTLGSMFLLAAGPDAWVNRLVLSRKPLVWVGLISYPLYLWHWPLLSFARIIAPDSFTVLGRVLLISLSIILSIFTYFAVEKPLRFGPNGTAKATWLLVLLLLLAAAGEVVYLQNGAPWRLPKELQGSNAPRSDDWLFPTSEMTAQIVEGMPVYHVGGRGPQTLFLGDSNCMQYGVRVSKLLSSGDPSDISARGAFFIHSQGIPPIADIRRGADSNALQMDLIKQYAARPDVDRIVFVIAWGGYFVKNKSDYGVFTTDDFYVGGKSMDTEEGRLAAFSLFAEMVSSFRAMGKDVFIISGIPCGPEFGKLVDPATRPIILVGKPSRLGQFAHIVSKDVVRERLKLTTGMLRRIAADNAATLIDPVEHLCPDNFCRTDINFDQGHLRATFVVEHARYIDVTVQ